MSSKRQNESGDWSSQLISQFKQLERRRLKKSGLQRDSNRWPPRYRCDALPTELWSHTLGARSIYIIIEFISPVRSDMMWSFYEIIHIWPADVDESEEWSSQLIFQFKQLERRSLKKSGLQWDSNPWPPRYLCDALPTELWSHTLGARSIYRVHFSLAPNVWLHSSVGRASHRYRGGHGFESHWSPYFFRLLLSNCLNWKINWDDHSSLSSTPAVQIWIISYKLHIKRQIGRARVFYLQNQDYITTENDFPAV